jgi:hypothetical protein
MTPFEIPLTAEPQRFTIGLGSTDYELTVRWCAPAQCWNLDIRSADGLTDVITGINLVTGANLLKQFGYLGFAGMQLVCQTDHDLAAPPTLTNLGSEGHVYFVTE